MDSVPHMPYMIAQTIALARGSVCQTSASVGAGGVAPTAVWTSVQMDVLAMDSVKGIDVNAKRGNGTNT